MRGLKILGWIVGVLVAGFFLTEVYVRTESVLYLIAMTCTVPFALIYLLTGRLLNRRAPWLAVVLLVIVGGAGLTMAWGNQFTADGFTMLENAFLLNLSTEVFGTALIIALLVLPRTWANVLLFVAALGLLVRVEFLSGPLQDIALNLSTELLGGLLAALLIYRFIEQFDDARERRNSAP